MKNPVLVTSFEVAIADDHPLRREALALDGRERPPVHAHATLLPCSKGHRECVLIEYPMSRRLVEGPRGNAGPTDNRRLVPVVHPSGPIARQQDPLARETQIGLQVGTSGHPTASHGAARPD